MYKPSRAASIIAFAVAVFLILPLLAVVPVSFTPTRFLSMPSGELSLVHYRALYENGDWLDAILTSTRIAIASSVLATALALAFCAGIWMFRPAFANVMIGFVLMPMVAPPVVSAITLYFFLTSLSKFNSVIAYDTELGVALAHTLMVVPFAVVLIFVSLSQVDARIDLAARGFGAGVLRRLFSIILPNIKFGVLTSLFMTFVLSWEEIGVTLFITSTDTITLPRMMWMGLRDNIDPAIAAISVILILLVVVIITLKTAITRRIEKSRSA